MAAMAGLKPAFAAGDMFNPGKIFPTGAPHAEVSHAAAVARTGAGAFI
jgi:hypothetical protein